LFAVPMTTRIRTSRKPFKTPLPVLRWPALLFTSAGSIFICLSAH